MNKTYEVVYEYDESGKFLYVEVAQYCPISGELLMPPNTTLEVPEIREGFDAYWNGEEWTYKSIEEPEEEEEGEGCLQ